MKKCRGKSNPTRAKRALRELADVFFVQSPLWRYIARGGRGRKFMREYRKFKNSRRPQCFRQDVW